MRVVGPFHCAGTIMGKLPVSLRIVAAGLLVSTCVWMLPDVAGAQVSDLGPFRDDDGHPGEPYLEWLAEGRIVKSPGWATSPGRGARGDMSSPS